MKELYDLCNLVFCDWCVFISYFLSPQFIISDFVPHNSGVIVLPILLLIEQFASFCDRYDYRYKGTYLNSGKVRLLHIVLVYQCTFLSLSRFVHPLAAAGPQAFRLFPHDQSSEEHVLEVSVGQSVERGKNVLPFSSANFREAFALTVTSWTLFSGWLSSSFIICGLRHEQKQLCGHSLSSWESQTQNIVVSTWTQTLLHNSESLNEYKHLTSCCCHHITDSVLCFVCTLNVAN